MNNPGLYNLGDVALAAVNAATTAAVVTASTDASGAAIAHLDGLDGMLAATLQADFAWGSGGTSLKVMVETSLDQGRTWIEVARFAFATASAAKVANLSGLTPAGVAVPAPLSDDTVRDGVVGPWWRARILTVGTYAGNTSLSLRLIAR